MLPFLLSGFAKADQNEAKVMEAFVTTEHWGQVQGTSTAGEHSSVVNHRMFLFIERYHKLNTEENGSRIQ